MSPRSGEQRGLLDDAVFAAQISYMERQRHRRRCLASALIGVSALVVLALGVWHLRTSHGPTNHTLTALAVMAKLNSHAENDAIPNGCESTLLLMRHCEKYIPEIPDANGNSHCSFVGFERSHYLTTLFGTNARWPKPEHLFALTPDRGSFRNYRQYETLLSLSKKTGVAIELVQHPEFADSYLELLQSGALCGKVAVVSWKHDYMSELAALLGCGLDQGCPQLYDKYEFDEVWMLKYVYRAPLDFAEALEKEEALVDIGNPPLHFNRKLYGRIQWTVFGSTTKQNFDSLAFSKHSGDYAEGGSPLGGSWQEHDTNDL